MISIIDFIFIAFKASNKRTQARELDIISYNLIYLYLFTTLLIKWKQMKKFRSKMGNNTLLVYSWVWLLFQFN